MLSPHRNRAAKAPSVPTGPGFDTATPELDFAKKYTPDHAQYYFDKHESLGRRLSNWREIHMARRALKLAREPQTVLDIPCGTGRFWPLLAEMAGRKIYAADLNMAMIETAVRMQPPELVARVETFQASAFSIPKPDGFVKTSRILRIGCNS
jgi:ubiquinone/menaquinone biosynthesis C-methylase UbiE